MKSRSNLNTRLLPLSILISSLISGAVLAAPSVAIPPSVQDLINQVQSYANAHVISPEQAETLIKRLTVTPEKLKEEEARVKQELAAVEKKQTEAKKEIITTSIEKDQFNKALNNTQKAKLAAETVFINANSKQNEAIKAVNKNWSLADENISTKLSVIVNGESKTQAILTEKIKLTEIANINQQEQIIKAQQLDADIQQIKSALADAESNGTTGTLVLRQKLAQAEEKLEIAKNNPKSKLFDAKAAHDRTSKNLEGPEGLAKRAAIQNKKVYEQELKVLQDPIDAAEEQLNTAQENTFALMDKQSALAGQKINSIALTNSLQEVFKQAKNAQLQAEQAAQQAKDATTAQQAMAEAAAAEKLLQEVEQKITTIAVIAQEAEAKLTAAQRAKADAELQLADKMEQLANINLDLTALNNLDPKVISQQTLAKGEAQPVADGELAMAIKVAGGEQNVTTGGVVLASVVTEDGVVNLSDNALAHDSQLINGTLNNTRAHDVNTQVGAQGKLLINGTQEAAATSEGATVAAGGSVTAGTNALVTKMVSAGTVTGNDGALFTETTLNDGQFSLNNGAIAQNTKVNGGQFNVNEGATAEGVTVKGGEFNLRARAQAMKLTIEHGEAQIAGTLTDVTLRGGNTTLASTADVAGTIHSISGSALKVYQGAHTAQADLNLAGRVVLFADDVAPMAALPSRAVRSADNRLSAPFTFRRVNMSGGTLDLRNVKNAQLVMDSLAGNGTFKLGSMLQQDASAPVNVTGNADGDFTLQIDGSGIDPTNLNVVSTGGGDARFTLTDGPIGLGNRVYNLVKDASGKVTLVANESTVTPGTASILAVANTTPVIFNAELSSVQQRLDKQSTEANESGIWGTYLHNNFAVKGRAANFDQTLNGITLGGDKATALADGVLSVGGFASASTSSIKTDYQSKGNVDSHSFGAYAQYLANNGYYVNGVVKANKFNQDIHVTSADNSASGNTNFSGMGVAVKAGKHINHNHLYVSPYVAMSAFSSGKSAVKLSNGMAAQSSSTRSMIGTLGVNAGYRFVLKNGVEMKPYVSASVDHEFAANNKFRVNQEMFDNNLNGTRISTGAGLNVNITPNLSVGSEVKLSNGKNIKTPVTFNLNVGYRF
ncbi:MULTISPECIES: autotransporter YapB [Yersinia pseudotuberculosis complex]|uniref:Putative autotransporter protein n=1 Tax=Yersinia pseudotuberculosis serotype O:1b (strain IP 31758) TaxID=349747 RepID=A0A0U1QY11_YERP3|nr:MULTISPECIES: autotransporter YapB [Yersinia pseudotuberculosis complex]ABS47571.1 putative autotransporter protein [Yersinia pseudotuberculosis IP 31758]MCE4112257.1 autotransporter YapB [Yersinia pseudotuberculosis]MCF1163009.1 autotransporter YapB [Yersinia pseudotuberculosis]RYC27653.1 autotransporter outer membrane beta-barrel domain-containing protein [Yersinia pseudotuberculosis]UFA60826.1 Autotransporter outer membrane beta-barrel domain-containing protein [Yersinia pseudotuberculos